jgi:hypothetical protein
LTAIKISPRWYPLRPHPLAQMEYARSQHRFNTVPAGRRSGKTERAKRKLVKRAISLDRITHSETPRFFAGAPTYSQAKNIYWSDLKDMTRPFWRGRPSETELVIRLVTGSELHVVGLDKPERIEGSPWDGGVLDEYGNMKPKAWGENVFPALADRNGWCDLIGVPEGRNHYYDIHQTAFAEMISKGMESDWGAFTWVSADVLPPEQIAAARRDLDELTFQQEYEASFVNFEGRAYYTFTDANKARLTYNPQQPLIVCLDFNVAPGVAAICQEMTLPNGQTGTGVIGQVYIENNSDTPMVCRKILTDWKDHTGRIDVYGDATGGARGTAQVQGSDWELVRKTLRDGDPSRQVQGWGQRVALYVKPGNPAERARVNALNSRTKAVDGTMRLFVDPDKAPRVVRDLEGVRTVKGGSGEIDKKIDPKLTHISDALGYYVEYRYPLVERATVIREVLI